MSLSRSHKSDSGPRVEINVVPLVDVSLVLLIIFMVTATFLKTAGMGIKLPSSSATRAGGDRPHDVIIGVAADGRFFREGKPVTDEELASSLRRDARTSGTDGRIIVQGDERAAHGRIVRAMTLAQEAGFSHLVISTRRELPRNERPHRD